MTFTSTRMVVGWGLILAGAGLGCGDDAGAGGGGTGGSDEVRDTASIELTGAQTESWSFNSDDNDFTCVR
ncbi:MAG: hypothetical protein RIF41_08145, partial [Polyangiaceae bacterium]